MLQSKSISRHAVRGALFSAAIVGVFSQQGWSARGLNGYNVPAVAGIDLAQTWAGILGASQGSQSPLVDNGGSPTLPRGSGDAVNTWTNAAGGPWATGTNWSLGVPPTAADDAIFNLASTYGVTLPTGATASTLQIQQGVVSLSGGTLNLVRSNTTTDPGVGATPGAGNAATALSVGLVNGQTSRLNVSGGTVLTYTQAYTGLNPTATGILDVGGAGTLLTPDATTGATNGRFGVVAGNGTINVHDGAEVRARLFEFGRQDGTAGNHYHVAVNVTAGGKLNLSNAGGQIVLPRGQFTDATMLIDGAGSFVHGANIFSGLVGSTSVVTVSNGGDLTGGQFTLGSGDGTNATLNMASGATATYTTAFTGGTLVSGAAAFNLSGANTRFRVDNVFVDQGGSQTTAVGTTNISVTSGAVLSVGRMNGHQDAALGGGTVTTNITVDGVGSRLEALNSTGFTNSYFTFGSGDGNGTANSSVSTITVRNGGAITANDTDGDGGSAFISVGGGNGGSTTTLNIQSGGSVTSAGQLTISDAIFVGGSLGSTATVNINGGSLVGGTSSFTALNTGNVANINVGAGGLFNGNGAISFGGGDFNGDFATGGGTTNLDIQGGGVVEAGIMILARDPGDAVGHGAQTNIVINGAGSVLRANGADDTLTAGIDDGFFTTAVVAEDDFGFPITGSGDGIFANVAITVSGGGLLKANEASFIGDTQDGSTTVTVTGANSIFDSGRQLSVNTGGLTNSPATINIASGGVVKTTGSLAQTSGSMFISTEPPLTSAGTTATTVTLTGTGSKLESSASIFLGGVFDVNDVETAGTPVTLTAGAGTIITAAGSLDLASNSTMTTSGTVSITGVSTIGGSWTIPGGNPFAGTLNVVGAGLVKLTNPTGSTATLLKTDNTLIAATAKVDVGKNAMRIRPEGVTAADTDLADVKAFLALGRTGAGTGGITSSALAANQAVGYKLVTTAGTFLGDTTAVGDILVRATFKGDTDLSGSVNFDDLLTLAQNYSTTPTGTGEWYKGDFNFDTNVNFDDLLALAQNYNNTLALGSAFVTGSFEGDWNFALSLVPEPTSIAFIGLAGAFMSRRRSAR